MAEQLLDCAFEYKRLANDAADEKSAAEFERMVQICTKAAVETNETDVIRKRRHIGAKKRAT